MADFRDRLEAARRHVEVEWSDGRAQAVERRMVQVRRRRQQLRAVGGVALLIAMVAAGAIRMIGMTDGSGDANGVGTVKFADGSLGTPLGTTSSIKVVDGAPTNTVVEVVRGGARFRVAPRPKRSFRVHAGVVTVEVLGTEFRVERVDTENRVRVSVEHGRVRVLAEGSETILTDGQSELFPRVQPVAAAAVAAATAAVESRDAARSDEVAAPVHKPATSTHERESWRRLAKEGLFDRAYDVLHNTRDAPAMADVAADLLLAADVARLSHHPSEATEPLEKVIRDHASDPRAPLAAFTLGRILLDDLGEPKRAARAFADAQRLAPTGPLSEDALAREVEAWSRSGDGSLATERAKIYLERYPQGSRVRSVRRHGGFE